MDGYSVWGSIILADIILKNNTIILKNKSCLNGNDSFCSNSENFSCCLSVSDNDVCFFFLKCPSNSGRHCKLVCGLVKH